ncbi:MAG: hypothetical protein ABI697_07020 [Devosia sp.]
MTPGRAAVGRRMTLAVAGLFMALSGSARADDGVVASAYDGKGVHETFTLMGEIMSRCAEVTGDSATYDNIEAEYVARNAHIRDLANAVLDYWGETYDATELAPSRSRKLDAMFAASDAATRVCAAYQEAVLDGRLDFSEYAAALTERLYASDRAIAQLGQ